METQDNKPNCYECTHRRNLAGDAHSRCEHPVTRKGNAPMAEMLAIFAGVGRSAPCINVVAAVELNIKADPHGIRKGWFNWPYNFDPHWLVNCNGFIPKEGVSDGASG